MSDLNIPPADAPQVQSMQPAQPQVQQVDIPTGKPIPMQGQVPGSQVANPLKYVQGVGGAEQAVPVQPPQIQQYQSESKAAWMPDDLNTFNVDSLSDPILRSAASVMQSIPNIDLNRVMRGAVSHGDPDLIDYQYIHEACAGTSSNPAEIARLAKGIVQAVQAQADAVEREVHTIAGGEAAWNSAVTVFNRGADPAIKLAVKTMLDSTDPMQIKAAAKIVSEFGAGSGVLPNRGTVSDYVGAYPGVRGGNGIGSIEYKNAIAALSTHALSPSERSAKLAELTERRKIGKQLGM